MRPGTIRRRGDDGDDDRPPPARVPATPSTTEKRGVESGAGVPRPAPTVAERLRELRAKQAREARELRDRQDREVQNLRKRHNDDRPNHPPGTTLAERLRKDSEARNRRFRESRALREKHEREGRKQREGHSDEHEDARERANKTLADKRESDARRDRDKKARDARDARDRHDRDVRDRNNETMRQLAEQRAKLEKLLRENQLRADKALADKQARAREAQQRAQRTASGQHDSGSGSPQPRAAAPTPTGPSGCGGPADDRRVQGTCVVLERKVDGECYGGAARASFVLRNRCNGRIYGSICMGRTNGKGDACESINIQPGKTQGHWTCDTNGRWSHTAVFSANSSEDWTCNAQ